MKYKAKRKCDVCEGEGYFMSAMDFPIRCDCYKETKKWKNRKALSKPSVPSVQQIEELLDSFHIDSQEDYDNNTKSIAQAIHNLIMKGQSQ